MLPRPEECLRQARSGITRVQQLLTDPTAEAMLRCEVCLREVADRLRQFPQALAKAGALKGAEREALISAATAAKDDLAHASRLFHRAGHFYSVWIRHFSALRYGYTRTGSPARLTCTAEIAVRG